MRGSKRVNGGTGGAAAGRASSGGAPALAMLGAVIEIDGLTKEYGSRVAVDDLTVTIEPGRVTGFLGPNGSGKTTTMRCILGLARPTSGTATVLGRPYRAAGPADAPGGRADRPAGPASRADGVRAPARPRAEQRPAPPAGGRGDRTGRHRERRRTTGCAASRSAWGSGSASRAALLGDPDVLVLDEPVNGLDPEGIRWVRELLRDLADEGRTVLVSSHLMSEMEETADHLVVLGHGRLLADLPMAELLGAALRRPGAQPHGVAAGPRAASGPAAGSTS